jgi:lipopolysaccharide biosynthesis regulator YciM
VLTKTKQPELHRYSTVRDRAANVRLFRLASEVLRAIEAIEAEAFHPIVGWQCKDCPFRSKCWAWGRPSTTPWPISPPAVAEARAARTASRTQARD